MSDAVLAESVPDVSPARQMNGQVVILEFGQEDRTLRVLLQKRSHQMSVMPGYLGSVGGMRDKSDADSRVTAWREAMEETGLEGGVALPLSKFAEGAKVDWYVMRLENPVFAAKAHDQWECGDIGEAMPFLPPSSVRAVCYGHAWVPVADLHLIHHSQSLMGGLVQKIRDAVRHIGLESQLTRTQGEMTLESGHQGIAQQVTFKGKANGGKGAKGKVAKGSGGKGYTDPMLEPLSVERAQSLPDKIPEIDGELVAFQLSLGSPWCVFGPSGKTFSWNTVDKNAVSDDVKSNVRVLLQAYADEHGIPLFGQALARIALRRGDFWVSVRGGVASAVFFCED